MCLKVIAPLKMLWGGYPSHSDGDHRCDTEACPPGTVAGQHTGNTRRPTVASSLHSGNESVC